MDLVSINNYFFNIMKEQNESLQEISLIDNTMTYNNQIISLDNLNLQELYNDYSQLKADINTITPLDFFNIIKVNAKFKDNEKNTKDVKNSPLIKKISLITKRDDNNNVKQYVCLTTDDDIEHVLFNYDTKIALNTLKTLFVKNNNSLDGISENDLFERLESNTDLESEQDNYLISLNEYFNIIEKDKYSYIDQNKINVFNNFMVDLRTYRQYLVRDALKLLQDYEYYIQNLSLLEEVKPHQEEEMNKYNQATDNIPSIELKNEQEKAKILQFKIKEDNKDKMAGYANSILIVEITCIMAVVLSSIIFILIQK